MTDSSKSPYRTHRDVPQPCDTIGIRLAKTQLILYGTAHIRANPAIVRWHRPRHCTHADALLRNIHLDTSSSLRISNGTITVDSELDKGAILTVMLPLVEGNTEYVAKLTAIHPHATRHTCGPSSPQAADKASPHSRARSRRRPRRINARRSTPLALSQGSMWLDRRCRAD